VVNLSRRFKLEYNDAQDGTTIIAETGQDTGAPKIDRHVHIRRKNDPDILKLWLEGTDFGNSIPTDKSNFGQAQNGTDEPEILYKQYDTDSQSFKTQGRFYAKNAGSINENGELVVKLYSFMRYTAKQEVDMSDSSDIESAMQKVLPSGYTVVNNGNNVNIDGTYELNARREKGYQELTRNYNFALTFTAELDNSNNYKVKYEPVGQGGTVDTLVDRNQGGRYPIIDVNTNTNTFVVQGDRTQELVVNQAIQVDGSTGNDGTYTISSLNFDSNDNETDIQVNENVQSSTADGSIIPGGTTKFKSWEKDKTDSIINRVRVEGVNTNTGNQISQTANNTATQNKVGVKSRPVIKIGYLNGTDTEAQNEALKIARNYLVPGKDSQGNDIDELPESGRVKTSVYSDNVVNDSFQVISNRLNISDTYTCVQQRNFWPEGATELEFEFEQEALEEEARDKENLRDERARLYPSGQKNVGNQGLSNVSTGKAPSDTSVTGSVTDNDSDTSVSGSVDREGLNNIFDPFNNGYNDTSISTGSWDTVNGADINTGSFTSFIFYSGFVKFRYTEPGSGSTTESLEVKVRLLNIDKGEYFPSQNGYVIFGELSNNATGNVFTKNQPFTLPLVISGDSSLDFDWTGDDIELQVFVEDNSTVNSNALEVDGFAITQEGQEHGDNFSTTDNPHGHSDDFGTTDNDHGGVGQSSTHGIASTNNDPPQTDSKNVNTAKEEKTDR
jgi:hypothetical protein